MKKTETQNEKKKYGGRANVVWWSGIRLTLHKLCFPSPNLLPLGKREPRGRGPRRRARSTSQWENRVRGRDLDTFAEWALPK